MLAGAVGIIIQAPRCKPLPEMNWWNEGPLYEIGDVQAFSDNLEGDELKHTIVDWLIILLFVFREGGCIIVKYFTTQPWVEIWLRGKGGGLH